MTTTSTSRDAIARYAEGLEGTAVDPRRYVGYARRLFAGVPLAGRRLLDVGGGAGYISFYAAARGATVVCLEPAADGSNPQMDPVFRRLHERLGDSMDVRLDRRKLQELQGEAEGFDVLVLHNVINHLDEQACQALPRDPQARLTYVDLLSRLRANARPGADLLVSDCARLNLFGVIGVRNPFVPEIDWRLHQQPRVWAELLADAGFADARVRWNAMTRAGRLGDLLLSNWLGGFLTQSHFTLHARAGDQAVAC